MTNAGQVMKKYLAQHAAKKVLAVEKQQKKAKKKYKKAQSRQHKMQVMR